MLAASNVIELIAKVAITAVREQVDEERRCAKPNDQGSLVRQPLGCCFDSRDWHAAILGANRPGIANSISRSSRPRYNLCGCQTPRLSRLRCGRVRGTSRPR